MSETKVPVTLVSETMSFTRAQDPEDPTGTVLVVKLTSHLYNHIGIQTETTNTCKLHGDAAAELNGMLKLVMERLNQIVAKAGKDAAEALAKEAADVGSKPDGAE